MLNATIYLKDPVSILTDDDEAKAEFAVMQKINAMEAIEVPGVGAVVVKINLT